MFNEQRGDSDPLPYTQVDRAVKPKAALLASLMGTTPQHALGALVEFWDLNGDPRELEGLVLAGKHEVVLSADQVTLRFHLASGKEVDPSRLEALGLLEKRPDGYRVRGMSRYFKPVENRLRARAAGQAGGLASARARRERSGSAQPRSARRSESASEPLRECFESASEVASQVLEMPAKPAEPAVSGQRSSVNSSTAAAAGAHLPVVPVAPSAPPEAWLGDDFWAWAQTRRMAGGYVAERTPPRDLGSWWSALLMTPGVTPVRLKRAFEAFGRSKHWEAEGFPFRAFMKQLDQFMPPEVPRAVAG